MPTRIVSGATPPVCCRMNATALSKPLRVVEKLNRLESGWCCGRTTNVWENLPASTPTQAAACWARSRFGKEIMEPPGAKGELRGCAGQARRPTSSCETLDPYL